MSVKQTAGRDQLGEFAPTFAALNDDVLFGQVWSREDQLSLRDRSLVTVTALMAQGFVDSSFGYHLQTAKANGITREEIAEVLTHAAFYAGWPKAWAAFRMALEVWNEKDTDEKNGAAAGEKNNEVSAATNPTAATDPTAVTRGALATRAELEAACPFPVGAPNDAFAAHFDGQSFLAPVSGEQVPVFNVTFEPGCRNHWHIHHAASGGGQLLLCVAGLGWYQEWGKPARALKPGDVVNIPAEVKHWHGAAAHSWFSHLALEVPGTKTANEWCEPVDPAAYAAL